jgi:hypothetical protein
VVLQRWEAETQAPRTRHPAPATPARADDGGATDARPPTTTTGSQSATEAIGAWARVGRKGRGALKRLSVHRVHELEELVTEFLASVRTDATSFIYRRAVWYLVLAALPVVPDAQRVHAGPGQMSRTRSIVQAWR